MVTAPQVASIQVASIQAALTGLADPERQAFAQRSYPTAMQVLGVKVPDLRTVVKKLSKQLRPEPPATVVDLARQLVATAVHECRQVAYELIAGHKKALSCLAVDDLEQLGTGIDNWLSVDTFAALVAGPAWRAGQVPDELIITWTRSPDHWWRRAAVVCTVALNQKARGGTGDPARTITICKLVAADQHKMVAKALSWALRELAKREPEPVHRFLTEHHHHLPARVLREVHHKLDTGKKSG